MSFFKALTIEAKHAADHSDALRRLRARDIDGVLVKQVYEPDACAALCAELEAGRHGLVKTEFPAKFAAFFYGINLNLAHPDLRDYFAEAPRFREALARLLEGRLALESRLSQLFSSLDGGLAYGAPPGPRPDVSYMFTTLRAHRPGGYIPAHFDDEQAARPSYRLLTPLIRPSLFSFVIAFSKAEAGGALEVFDLEPEAPGQRIAVGDRSAARHDLETVEKISFRLDPGDIVIINSGRRLHRVTPVIGPVTRWTACSFMAERRDGGGVYCWG